MSWSGEKISLTNPHGEVIAKDIRGPKMGLEIGVEIAKWQF
jgi:hypothetical protein